MTYKGVMKEASNEIAAYEMRRTASRRHEIHRLKICETRCLQKIVIQKTFCRCPSARLRNAYVKTVCGHQVPSIEKKCAFRSAPQNILTTFYTHTNEIVGGKFLWELAPTNCYLPTRITTSCVGLQSLSLSESVEYQNKVLLASRPCLVHPTGWSGR